MLTVTPYPMVGYNLNSKLDMNVLYQINYLYISVLHCAISHFLYEDRTKSSPDVLRLEHPLENP